MFQLSFLRPVRLNESILLHVATSRLSKAAAGKQSAIVWCVSSFPSLLPLLEGYGIVACHVLVASGGALPSHLDVRIMSAKATGESLKLEARASSLGVMHPLECLLGHGALARGPRKFDGNERVHPSPLSRGCGGGRGLLGLVSRQYRREAWVVQSSPTTFVPL